MNNSDKIKSRRINIDSTHIQLKTDKFEVDIEEDILKSRMIIQDMIKNNPSFNGFEPVNFKSQHHIISLMINAGDISNTGPMSSVAGSISEICLDKLIKNDSKYSIIENGGDIALKVNKKVIIGVYAGKSKLTGRIGFKFKPNSNISGVCTSSGTVGHSTSFGITDATIVFAKTSSIADSLATSIGNYGTGESEYEIVENCISASDKFKDYFEGLVVIKDDIIGSTGNIPKLAKTNKKSLIHELYDTL
ncbi:MAG: UPF0280 family protein [Methanobacteriaceae archaeon]|nr:UPF0280 family protein [Methanobacteriaceae archaeon]